MNDKAYRAAIDEMKAKMVAAVGDHASIGVLVPAAMEMILSACLSGAEQDRDMALKATQSLHPMISYIESQILGVH